MSLTFSLIGRPNVGKSSLFNRLVGRRASLVHDEPRLTRDRIYGDAEFDGHKFVLIDTGGIDPDLETSLMGSIRKQAQIAIKESDAILFLVDGKSGLLSADREIAQQLRATQKPVFFVVNKTESDLGKASSSEFYELGFDLLFPISAAHGQGLDDVFESVFEKYPVPQTEEDSD